MEAFVITLREGVEAALIIALVVTYLNRTGRQALRRWVYAGLVLALAASLLGAFGFSRIGIDPESELLEGILYAVAAVLVVTLVVWMWRHSRTMKVEIENRLESLTAADNRGYGWGLLAFVFIMVFREGIETVLFLAALSLTRTPDLTAFVGGLIGLLLAAMFGILFIRGSLRINLRWFFAITSFVLLILAVRLAAGSLHEFHEVGLLSLPHMLEEGIEFLTEERTSTVILVALIILPLLTMIPQNWLRPISSRVTR